MPVARTRSLCETPSAAAPAAASTVNWRCVNPAGPEGLGMVVERQLEDAVQQMRHRLR